MFLGVSLNMKRDIRIYTELYIFNLRYVRFK